ncbi:uncharacterized protein LOC106877032 isoform X2 [Octopus bimaculoides]|uniref:uncharacterized protein LOC106877032 isoform X2 n=1 Tax=Octopus bimaculoides TaxID=37653 RepID=UPI0022E4E988|nr:uncharacterized protein LOC106877032 isoform X2 [Octopus bimaculoides]
MLTHVTYIYKMKLEISKKNCDVWHKMSLNLLLLVCLILKQIGNNLIDTKTIKIIPAKKIFKEVRAVQAVKCINNDTGSEHNGTSAFFYHILCKKSKSITVKFKTANITGTSTEMMSEISRDCKQTISKFNATVLRVHTVEVLFSSEKQTSYKISCINEKDKTEAYTRVQFGYSPSVASVHIERNVSDYISISVTPRTYGKNELLASWNISCQCSTVLKIKWNPCNIIRNDGTSAKIYCNAKYFYSFNITGIGLFGTYSKLYNYSIRKIPVRLPPFENIMKRVSQYSIHLSLNLLSTVEVYSLRKEYQVMYRSERDPEGTWKTESSSSNKIELNNLRPFTKYSILASVRERHSTIWNKNVSLIIKTKSAAPSSPPSTTDGNYFDLKCSNTSKRCLSVFWQSLPVEFRNDILTGYCVQYIDGSSSTNNTEQCLDSNNLIVDSLYKDFQDLPRNQTLTFSIVAVTKSKRMSQPAFIQVKNTAPRKPTAVYVMRISAEIYNITWTTEQPQESVNVTVFWCQNKIIVSSEIECKDYVKWKTLVNESYLLVNYSAEQSPVFAAYVSTEKGSSSLTNAECIFTPGKPMKPRTPSISWSQTKFSLTWPTLQCPDWNGIPIAYVLHYADGKSCENATKKEFPVIGIKAAENDVVINGLSPGTEYSVCIQVKTKHGLSLMSDTITGVTKDTEFVILVAIIVPISVFVILAILLCVKQYYSRYNKYKKQISIEYEYGINSAEYHYADTIRGENSIHELHFGIACENLVVNTPPENQTTGYDSMETLSEDSLPTDAANHIPSYIQNNELQDNAENCTYESFALSEHLTKPVPTCVNGNMKGNVSSRTAYADEPESSFNELSSASVPICVNGNMKENVSSDPDYVDEPNDLNKLVSNSIPPCKNTNSNGSITDYIFSEPDYISEIPEESTNSYKSKPLKGQILQTENKESDQIGTSTFNGRTDEENVKVNCNDDYVPHEHVVEAMESSLDEVQDKNIQKERQGISQNSMNSCNLVNTNVHKPSDSLQRVDKKLNKLQQKDTQQKPDTIDYVKTEIYL